MFGAVFNADFGSFGLEVSFDYSIYQNYSETGKYLNTPYSYKESESLGVLALTPYFPLQLAQFDLIVGPIIGAGFYKYQSETKYEGFDPTTYKQTRSYFIWGGNVELRKEIKDHINGYIGLPLIFRAGSGDLKTWSNGTEVKNEGKSSIFGASKMHFAPKIGVTYSF